jgi:hypothetical protein
MVYDTQITIVFMGFINHQRSLGGHQLVGFRRFPRSGLAGLQEARLKKNQAGA